MAVFQYISKPEYFNANSIAFQNDLIANGNPSIFVNTVSSANINFASNSPVFQYISKPEYFNANSIAFENDLIANGNPSIFVNTVSSANINFNFNFFGSDSIIFTRAIEVATRSNFYITNNKLYTRNESYTPSNTIYLRTGLVSLLKYESSSNFSVTFNPQEDSFQYIISGSSSSTITNITSGSGSLFSSASGSAKVTFNPPEDTYLFGISGAVSVAIFKATPVYSGSGSLFSSASGSASVTFNPPEDTYLFGISGSSSSTKTNITSGSGSLSSSASGSAKVTFNPPEDTYLFSVSGSSSSTKTNITSGSGSLSSSASGSANVIFNPPEDIYLFDISGSSSSSLATINITSGSGLLSFDGAAVIKTGGVIQNVSEVGSGSITTDISGSASVTFNPPEDTYLFVFSGGYSDIKVTSSYLKTNSNLFNFSEQFENTYWNKTNLSGTITANQTTAPDGTITADLYQEDVTTTGRYISKGIPFISGTQYTISIWAKQAPGSTRYLGLILPNATFGVNTIVSFTLSGSGSYNISTSGTNTSARIIPYPDGWYRCYLTSQATATTSGGIQIRLSNSPVNAAGGYAGDGTSGIYVWGAKLEYANIATPYIADSGTILYDNYININGTATTNIINSFSGSGTFTETGESNQATAQVAFIEINTIILYNTNAITKLAMQYAGKSPTTPFGALDIIFEELEANAPPQEFKYTGSSSSKAIIIESSSGIVQISGTVVEKTIDKWLGSGSISVSGDNLPSISKQLSGSGSITTDISGSANVTFNPPEDTYLFGISGSSSSKAIIIESSSGIVQISGTVVEKTIDKWLGSGSISVSGDNLPSISKQLSGSGSLSSSASGSASVTFNPPEDTYLFGISGSSSSKAIIIESSSGIVQISGTVVEKTIDKWLGSGSISVSGQLGDNIFKPNWISQGSITISGQLGDNIFKPNWISQGSITTSASGSAKVTFNPPEDTYLFGVSGSASQSQTNRIAGSGSISVSGQLGDNIFKPNWISQGSITTSASGSASVTFNPPEDTYLFGISGSSSSKAIIIESSSGIVQISGTVVEKTIDKWLGSGSISVSGQLGDNIFKPNWISQGSITTSASGSASVTFNPPEDTYLFGISGQHGNRVFVPNWISQGSITTSASGSASVTFNPPEDTYLFSVSGQATIEIFKAGFKYSTSGTFNILDTASIATLVIDSGSGSISVSGQHGNRVFVPNWISQGSITTSASGSANVTFNPPEDTYLFSVSGSASQSQTNRIAGSGSISVSGQHGTRVFVPNWNSSGSLFTLASGSASVTFNPPEDTYLYTISGNAVPKSTNITSGSGSLFSGGFYSNLQATFNPPEDTYLFSVSGQHGNRVFVPNWISQGSITTSASGSASVTFNPPEDTYLFGISGTAEAKSTNITSGSGSLFSGGFYSNLQATFNPPEDTYLFSVSGQHGNRVFVPNWNSSGSLFASASGTASTTFNPPEDTYLFAVSGAATVLVPIKYFGSGSITTSASGSASVTVNPPEDTYLYTISGNAVPKSTNITSGSGSLFSGGFYSNLQATFNPPEDTYLFDISGSASQSQTNRIAGSGSISVSGQHGNGVFVPNWISQGSITTSASGSASVTFNPPEDTYLFGVFGSSDFKQTNTYPKTNSNLFDFSEQFDNSYWSKTFLNGTITANQTTAPDETITADLYQEGATNTAKYLSKSEFFTQGIQSTISIWAKKSFGTRYLGLVLPTAAFGVAVQAAFTLSDAGSYTINISGTNTSARIIPYPNGWYRCYLTSQATATNSSNIQIRLSNSPTDATVTYQGDGTSGIYLWGAQLEYGNVATSYTSDSGIILYDNFININGTSTTKIINSFSGSGTINVSNQASASVTFNPPEDTYLFGISGQHGSRVFVPNWNSSGSITTSASGSASVTFNPPEDTYLFGISGSSSSATINITSGSGSLLSSASGSAKVTFNPPEDTYLFSVSGQHGTKVFVPNWNSSGSITISGQHGSRVFVPNWNSSGSIFEFGESYQNRTIVPIVGNFTYNFSGSANIVRKFAYESNISINIYGLVIVRTVFQENIFATII